MSAQVHLCRKTLGDLSKCDTKGDWEVLSGLRLAICKGLDGCSTLL